MSYLQAVSMACLAADNLHRRVILVPCPVAARAIKCRWRCIESLKVCVFRVHPSEHEVGSGNKSLSQGELHLWHISLTAVRSNSTGDCLYFGCHCSGLGKASSTIFHGQDQDFCAEAPPWLMISSWKLFYIEEQSCSGTHSSHFCNSIFLSIPTYRQRT